MQAIMEPMLSIISHHMMEHSEVDQLPQVPLLGAKRPEKIIISKVAIPNMTKFNQMYTHQSNSNVRDREIYSIKEMAAW